MLNIEVRINDDEIVIISQKIRIKIVHKIENINENEVYILMKNRHFVSYVNTMDEIAVNDTYDKIIVISSFKTTDEETIKKDLINNTPHIEVVKEVMQILEVFGYNMKKEKKVPTKAQHRWNKQVSQIEFYVNTRESKATVVWQKRNEMLLKAKAIMMKEAPLNKDGTLGLSAKMGNTLREEHKDAFKDFVTTKDIVLKSVNEVGLFLYFAGTNSWLELVDKDGKTIDDWTLVK